MSDHPELPTGNCLNEAPHHPHRWTPASAQVWWCPGVKSPWLVIEMNDGDPTYCGMYTSRDSAVLAIVARQNGITETNDFNIDEVRHELMTDERPYEKFSDGDCWECYIILANDAVWKSHWFASEGTYV